MATRPRKETFLASSSYDDDDHNDSDAVINQEIAVVEARYIPSTPSRRSAAFGLETPVATPGRLRLHSCNSDSISPHTPLRLRDVPKDIKPLTSPEQFGKGHTPSSITLPLATGLPTPDNTPPRNQRPFPHRKETSDKTKSETSWLATELLQNELSRIIEPEDVACTVRYHHDQDPDWPISISSAKANGLQRRQSEDTATNAAIVPDTQCRGITLRGVRCKRTVSPLAQHCFQHKFASHDTEITPTTLTTLTGTLRYTAANPATELDIQCRGITLRGVRCKRTVNPPVQHCFQHIPASHGTEITPTATTTLTGTLRYSATNPAVGLDTQCRGITRCGVRCKRTVKFPAQHCFQHIPASDSTQVTRITPTTLTGTLQYTATSPTTESITQCCGITQRGVRCKRTVKFPTQHCFQHISASNSTQVTPITPTTLKYTATSPTTELSTQCRGITQRGVRCKRTVRFPAQHCFQHVSTSDNARITLITPTTLTGALQYTTRSPTTELSTQCRGISQRGVRCKRAVRFPAQHCVQHISTTRSIPITPTTPTTPTTGRRCRLLVSISPGQPTNECYYCRYHLPTSAGTVVHVDEVGFKVQKCEQAEVLVPFIDHIPQYLQPETQQKLQAVITGKFSERVKIPGYIYALNVVDREQEGNISWKIGYTKDVKKRHKSWREQCPSYIRGVRGWWPGSITRPGDYDETLVQELIARNQQGDAGPMAEQLERLVHIELRDLATNAPYPYLHPDWPDVKYLDIPRLERAASKPCSDCKARHREIFSFRRFEKGDHFGREWEDIVEPVIKRWGEFLKKYFAVEA